MCSCRTIMGASRGIFCHRIARRFPSRSRMCWWRRRRNGSKRSGPSLATPAGRYLDLKFSGNLDTVAQVKALSLVCVWLIGYCGQLLAAKATEMPRTDAELNQWCPEPPAGKNAASLFVQGAAAMSITKEDSTGANLPWIGNAATPAIDQPLSSSLSNSIKEFLNRNEAAFDYFRRAAVLKEARYPWDMTLGPDAPLPHLRDVKLVNKSLALYVLDRANSGDGEKAVDGLMIQFALIESLESEPILISQETRADCVQYILFSLTQMLNRVNVPSGRLGKIEEQLDLLERKEAEGYGFKRG